MEKKICISGPSGFIERVIPGYGHSVAKQRQCIADVLRVAYRTRLLGTGRLVWNYVR